ncbi:MAG: nuclear transport factor 2 family protein [Thermoplasmatota archaeon]
MRPSVVNELYGALAARNGDRMAACYHPEAHFCDPVFPRLVGPQVGAMWRMLCERAQDLQLTLEAVDLHGGVGTARWRASYTFAATGRAVTNHGKAWFAVRDGLLIEHRDEWDFHAWARQALGWRGAALGWSKPFQRKVQRQAARQLEAFPGAPVDARFEPAA